MVDNETIQASLDKIGDLAQSFAPKAPKSDTEVRYTQRADTGARRTVIVDDHGESKLMGPIRYMDDPRMVAANGIPLLQARAFIMAGMAIGSTDHVAEAMAMVGGASALLDAYWLVNDPRGVLRKKTAVERAWSAKQITDAQDRLDHTEGRHTDYVGGCPTCWREWSIAQGWAE